MQISGVVPDAGKCSIKPLSKATGTPTCRCLCVKVCEALGESLTSKVSLCTVSLWIFSLCESSYERSVSASAVR